MTTEQTQDTLKRGPADRVKHFVGWISLSMLKRGINDIPVFRTAEIAHQHTGEDAVYEVDVNLSGKVNFSTSNSAISATGKGEG
ncbi:hypothetical protein [Thiocapsa sp. N5-Cardenillas]|uniref:hypothetical protein n=1 Tax=Thiocapsa sp. N5-Cardenillas TaxID=3137397 RepID=UPI0035AF818E